ncbi:unnamed protein product, partial [Ilex paraguariensis]
MAALISVLPSPTILDKVGILLCSDAQQPFLTIANIDLNRGDIVGYLLEELGLLTNLALFHINRASFVALWRESTRASCYCSSLISRIITDEALFEATSGYRQLDPFWSSGQWQSI